MVQFASYLRCVLCKTRLIFPRINGPNIILSFYNEVVQTCNFVDSCLNYRFSLAFMRIPDCDDSSICLRQKNFIDDSKMCHELYNVKPTYNYY